MWYPSIQFTFRYFEPSKNVHIWKSTNVSNFKVAPSPALDRRSSKSDQFSITLDPASPGRYTIEGKHDDDVAISVTFDRLAAGWKVGAGPKGGMSYFGQMPSTGLDVTGARNGPETGKAMDGYCIHRFWPRCAVSGIVRLGNEVVDLEGSRGLLSHAIQGMRPDNLACRWNFANFQSPAAAGDGVALAQMEFTTTKTYGYSKVNIGSVVVGDQLVAVTAGGTGIEGKSTATYTNEQKDDTGYMLPGQITYNWEGPTIFNEDPAKVGAPTKAELVLNLAKNSPGAAYDTNGLIQRVDVLGELPWAVKKIVNATGANPYIYTWLNEVPVKIETVTEAGEAKTIEAKGVVFNEASYVSKKILD